MQRYFAVGKSDSDVILSDSDYHHIKRVMRMKNGDNIEVVYDNILYSAVIDNLENNKITICNKIDQESDKYPYIRLIIPMLKEQKLDLILQKSTEIGVNEIIIVPFQRSMVKCENNKEKTKLDRWKKILKEASEQSMRLDIPIISFKNNMSFVNELDGYKFICSTNEKDNNIKHALKKVTQYDKISLVIGPEGGISKEEEAYLVEKGFEKITLGTQIMRVETVPIFLTSIIRYEYME